MLMEKRHVLLLDLLGHFKATWLYFVIKMYWIKYILWRTQTPPWRTFSEIFWIIFSGWYLFLLYVTVAVGLCFTIIGIPFVFKIFEMLPYVFNPIGYGLVSNRKTLVPNATPTIPEWYHDPHHPFIILVNVVWFVLFGWEFFLMHIVSALVQLLTIVGVGNAITNCKIAITMLAPFGRHIEAVPYPTKPFRKGVAPVLPVSVQSQTPVAPVNTMTTSNV